MNKDLIALFRSGALVKKYLRFHLGNTLNDDLA